MSSSVSSLLSISGHIDIFSSTTNHISIIWWRKPSCNGEFSGKCWSVSKKSLKMPKK